MARLTDGGHMLYRVELSPFCYSGWYQCLRGGDQDRHAAELFAPGLVARQVVASGHPDRNERVLAHACPGAR